MTISKALFLKHGFNGCKHRFRGFNGQPRLSLKGFSVLFALLIKAFHFLLSYLLRYTCLKGKPQISRKERFIYIYIYTFTTLITIYIYLYHVSYHIYISYIYIYYIYTYIYIYICIYIYIYIMAY